MPNFEFVPSLEIEAILDGDIERILPIEVREVLLDVILAWANLDMATAFFVATVSGLDPHQGAEKFGRKEIAEKLKRAAIELDKRGYSAAAAKVREIAKSYPEKAFYRRRIAHSKCAGIRKSDPSRVIFLPFEQEGRPGNLAVEVIDLAMIVEATKWAIEVNNDLMEHVDAAGFFNLTN